MQLSIEIYKVVKFKCYLFKIMNSSCEKIHNIALSNINTDNIIVYTEILLVKGVIENRCPTNQVVLRNQKTGSSQNSNLSKHNEFKVLCQLVPGKQSLELIYCSKVILFQCCMNNVENPYTIQPLYVIFKGHNGSFKSLTGMPNDYQEACRIIDLNLKVVQCLFAEKLDDQGFGRKSFHLKDKCQVFYSNMSIDEARQFDEISLWNAFGKELLNSAIYNDNRVKYIGFLSCTVYFKIEDGDFSYENIDRHTKGHAALGVGGLAIFGSGYFYAWPRSFNDIISCFTNQEKVDLENYLDNSNYRRTFGGVYATSLGAICHEIGHIFDLGHTKEGIMGNGFDYINRVFTVDNITENLPTRVFNKSTIVKAKDKRLTNIKSTTNSFLEKYHEQKLGDSVFFTRSCSIILAYHKWLQTEWKHSTESASINFNPLTKLIHSKIPIKLIEIRQKPNALVVSEFEFNENENINCFQIPNIYENIDQYSIFIICINGDLTLI